MDIILGRANSGRTTKMLQQAKEVSDKGASVLVISDEMTHMDILKLGKFDRPVNICLVNTMKDILHGITAHSISSLNHVFIDAHFLDVRDTEFLDSLGKYMETDITLTIQARSKAKEPIVEMSMEEFRERVSENE